MAFDEKKYRREYRKEKYYRAVVNFPKEYEDEIRDAALAAGLPATAWIKKIILFELAAQKVKK